MQNRSVEFTGGSSNTGVTMSASLQNFHDRYYFIIDSIDENLWLSGSVKLLVYCKVTYLLISVTHNIWRGLYYANTRGFSYERFLCYGNTYMIVWNIAYPAATAIYETFEFQISNFQRLINEIFCRNVNGMSWCIPNISNM